MSHQSTRSIDSFRGNTGITSNRITSLGLSQKCIPQDLDRNWIQIWKNALTTVEHCSPKGLKVRNLRAYQATSNASNRTLSRDSAVLISPNVVSALIQHERSGQAKKSSVQIRFDILEFLYYHTGAHSRTSLWRHATRLSYDDFEVHLASLEDKGLVQELDGGIRLTLTGKELYLKLRETLPSIL